jgi:hypothetical protein
MVGESFITIGYGFFRIEMRAKLLLKLGLRDRFLKSDFAFFLRFYIALRHRTFKSAV